MKDRILEFLRAENKSSSQLAEEIGVQPSGISHILSGRNKPSLDFILKMLEKYPFISIEWLLFGEGDMYKDHQMQELFSETAQNDKIITSQAGNLHSENPKQTEKVVKPVVSQVDDDRRVEKIVWFYKDGSFREYIPENE